MNGEFAGGKRKKKNKEKNMECRSKDWLMHQFGIIAKLRMCCKHANKTTVAGHTILDHSIAAAFVIMNGITRA